MLHLSQDQDADKFLTGNWLALLIGMVLDQQVTIEKAFSSPAELSRRLGAPLDAAAIAAMPLDDLTEIFRERPALHRYPGSMAKRVQDVCRVVATDYANLVENIWKGVTSGDELVGRLNALPGFGIQKSKIFAALTGQTARGESRRLGNGHHALRGRRCLPVGGGHHESRVPREGAGEQAGHQGQGARQGVSARRDLSGRRLYLCTPDRPDLADFVAACIAGGVDVVQLREKHLEARATFWPAPWWPAASAGPTASPSC